MRGTAHSKQLWWALALMAIVAVTLLAGCPKPEPTPPPPPPGPPALPPSATTNPGAPDYNAPGAKPATEAGKVQTAADPAHMTELEQKHVPQFALPKDIASGKPVSVTVNVGKVPHPMTADHYIQWIELYLDGTLVKKAELKPSGKATAKFDVTMTAGPHTLKSDIMCNKHGLWENTTDVTAK